VQLSDEAERKLADQRMKKWSKDQEEYTEREFQLVQARHQEQSEKERSSKENPSKGLDAPEISVTKQPSIQEIQREEERIRTEMLYKANREAEEENRKRVIQEQEELQRRKDKERLR
jgi:hypothetical protein